VARVTESGLPLVMQPGRRTGRAVFDGASLALNAIFQVAMHCRRLKKTSQVAVEQDRYRLADAGAKIARVLDGDKADYAAGGRMREDVEKKRISRVVDGRLGGIDSALCAAIAVGSRSGPSASRGVMKKTVSGLPRRRCRRRR